MRSFSEKVPLANWTFGLSLLRRESIELSVARGTIRSLAAKEPETRVAPEDRLVSTELVRFSSFIA
jgi:hypothetical protein